MSVFVILPVHDRKEITVQFCDCLVSQTFKDISLILVDDGSSDGTADAVAASKIPAKIIRGDGNLWWAGGVRKGISQASKMTLKYDDVVLLVNDDTRFDSGFIERAVAELNFVGRGAMLAVPVLFTDSGNRAQSAFRCYWPHLTFHDFGSHPERVDCASTRCLLVRWGDLRRVGNFRPRFLPHYLSDLEFTIRARRKGLRIMPSVSLECCSTEFTSGRHAICPGSARKVLRDMFSNKFSANPLHIFMFVLLAAPLLWKPICWTIAARASFSFFLRATIIDRLLPHK